MRNRQNPHSVADLPLFAPPPAPSEQTRNLERVSGRIATSILDFCRQRLVAGRPVFAVADLHAWVQERHPGAPGSPDRVLRDLRSKGAVAYHVVSRSSSLYQLLEVAS